jgi:hypothetical protein
MTPELRTVVEAEGFRPKFRKVVPHPRYLDQLLEAAIFALARDPERAGVRVRNTGLWVMDADLQPLGIRLLLFYTFDDQKVTLHDAYQR